MDTNLIIRKMKAQDIEEIVNIEKECFSLPWSFQSLMNEIKNNNAYFVVAIKENKIVAYAGMHCTMGDCFITNVAVKSENRRNGIGKGLLNHLVKYAKEKDYNFVTLEVRKSNIAAQSLYKKFDFKEIGFRKNFYTNPKEDAIIMTNFLNKKKK